MHFDDAGDALWVKATALGMVLSQPLLLLEVLFITENPSAEHAETMAFGMNEKHII